MPQLQTLRVHFKPSQELEPSLYERLGRAMNLLERSNIAHNWHVLLVPHTKDQRHIGYVFSVSFVGDTREVSTALSNVDGVRTVLPPTHILTLVPQPNKR